MLSVVNARALGREEGVFEIGSPSGLSALFAPQGSVVTGDDGDAATAGA